MTRIQKLYSGIGAGCVALALLVAGNAVAQQQDDRDQQRQSDRDQRQSNQQDQQQSRLQQDDQQRQQSQQGQQQSRDDRWPQPNQRDYGSDSLNYERDRSSNRDKEGGLGVSLVSDGRDGIVVTRVHRDSPAEQMGIREGDRITQVNGREVQSVQQFISRVRNMEPGEEIELDIRRAAGDQRTVRGELESREEALVRQNRQQKQRGWTSDQGDRFSRTQNRDWQTTSYESDRGRSSQISSSQLNQLERQVESLCREVEDLRMTMQNLRRQSGDSDQWNRERTARYEEYERDSDTQRFNDRRSGSDTVRQADRDRSQGRSYDGQSTQRSSRSSDRYDEGPGGEIGSDRQRVGSDDLGEE